jgi:ankyrin repeat protein
MKPYILTVSLWLLCSCSPAASLSPVSLRPEQAFSDPKQVALAAAAAAGDVAKIEAAVKAGADVKAVGKSGITPLLYAFTAQKKDAFKRLLEMGADPNARSEHGEPLVGYSAMISGLDYLQLLFEYGANPNVLNTTTGQPAIYRAFTEDRTEKLALYIKAKADINIRGRDGSTPIILASTTLQMRIVMFLLNNGADPTPKDSLGIDIASGLFSPNWDETSESYRIRNEIIKLLESRGYKFDWAIINKAEIANLDEATGKVPPLMLKK